MTYNEFNEFCGSMPATTYVMQWGNSHVWKVGGKVFAIGGWEKANNKKANAATAQHKSYSHITFKTSDLNYHFLSEKPGFRPAPYLASRGMKWIQQYALEDDEELVYYLQESYKIVSLGLSKKKQRELGLNQPL